TLFSDAQEFARPTDHGTPSKEYINETIRFSSGFDLDFDVARHVPASRGTVPRQTRRHLEQSDQRVNHEHHHGSIRPAPAGKKDGDKAYRPGFLDGISKRQ